MKQKLDNSQDHDSGHSTPESTQAPISEAEFHDLYHTLERRLEASPCDESLRHTLWYVHSRQLSEGDVMDWVVQQVGTCDGAVLRCTEAYFTETRLAGQKVQLDALDKAYVIANGDQTSGHNDGMPLSEEDFFGLCDALEGIDCDGSLRVTRGYLRDRQIDEATLVPWLEAHGGHCDCEVMLNAVCG